MIDEKDNKLTYIDDNGIKKRVMVEQKEAQDYFNRRSELLEELTWQLLKQNKIMSYDDARRVAWQNVYPYMWEEFHCCYYSCKTFHFTAWTEQGNLAEVYELTREISRKEDGRG